MKRTIKIIFIICTLLLLSISFAPAYAQPNSLPVDVPREELLVVDQIVRLNTPGNLNFWLPAQLATRHALIFETLWYRDQQTGERLFGAAAADPIYNEDSTQMTVELRDNIYWSDGVQFTADDLLYTIETLQATPEFTQGGWGAALNQFIESVEKVDDFTVQFNLSETNPRFHTLFETRWNGVYMMPKHHFETIDDLTTYAYIEEGAPVLGTYQSVDFDPNGFWHLFERREDWDRSPAGIVTGNSGPRYVLTILYGDSTRKVIAMSRGELDVFFDVDFEAFETLLDSTPTARSWYEEFPWAYPNEVSSRQLMFNFDGDPVMQNKDVRWALALALDIVELQTEYIGGVAQVSAIPIPPVPALREIYHDPMEDWLLNLEIEVGDGETFQPYDPTVPDRIAAWAESQGFAVPGDASDVFGTGWWKHAPDVAAQLLLNNGFTKDGDQWLTPDGEVWSIDLQAAPDEPDAFRIANAAADMWSEFGVDVNLQGLERSLWNANTYTGQYEVSVPWGTFTQISGDSWPESRSWHPEFYVPVGEDSRSTGGIHYFNAARIQDPQVAEFIDSMVPVSPDSQENIDITTEFVQYWVENMNFITVTGFKKFTTWDERYWTNFPTAENPEYMPLFWFQGGKFAIQNLVPAEQ